MLKSNLLAVGLAGVLMVPALRAAEPSKADAEFFENKVRPILVTSCYKCHSSQAPKLKGGLSVESREALLKGGETSPAIVPGDPEKSLLIKAVRYGDPDLQMPPKDRKLDDSQIADLTTWVKMGAPYPKVSAAIVASAKTDKDHWSFKPVRRPAIPDVKEKDWVATPVDAFIVAKLEENGMKPGPLADKRTLIRRATFDLIGLAPTLKETQDFLDDNSTNAYAKVVDRLLASPQYGERWGRFWLDTARYSDTKGDVKQQKEDFRYPFAWTYRDYVIKAFNDDKPYNRFIVEQIAADKLPLGSDRSALAAMGFLTVGERFDDNMNDIYNDRIDVVTKGFLGLTVTCARCHDHKFDPIPTQDYYSLRGIFASSIEPTDEPIISKLDTSSPEYQDFARQYNTLNSELATYNAIKRGKKTKEIKQKETQLRHEIALLELNHPGSPPRAMVLEDSARPADSYVFLRGEAENRGPIAPRRFLEILSGPTRPVYRSGSGRLELAAAIASPNNPLTARVMVNRIWLHHFGAGIVTTPDDFGNQSAPPSHPELLDYLASEFVADGWSIKKMHRLIMLSHVYQESSENNPHYEQQDPNNRLLWRANIRRLEFEAVRDSLLAMGGKLDLTMGGHPVNLGATPYSTRRTVYGYVDRRNLPEVFNQFDFANPDITTGKRYETIVPQQALFMMNSPLVVEQARNLVNRSDFKDCSSADAKIKLLYDIIYQREPTPVEVSLGENFLKDSPPAERPDTELAREENPGRGKKMNKGNKKKGGEAMSLATIPAGGLQPLGAWAKYAHALLQANEAMFIN